VRVEGAKNTRESFLAWLINPHLTKPSEPSNLESVLHTTRHLSHIFQETGVFQSVEANIERSRDVMTSDGDVDVVFKAREKGRYFVKTATEMGNGEGNAVRIILCKIDYL
jgi:outer membrane protein insertion porin family